MGTIVYLDVDDEITSAATRLRNASDPRVALVLPFGSRLSTSRMNFRLLAREASQHGRHLAVIAPDAGTRALAASAGLAVFSSVSEYEEAGAGRGDDRPDVGARPAARRPPAPAAGAALSAPAATGGATNPASQRPDRSSTGPARSAPTVRGRHEESDDATLVMPTPAVEPRSGRPAADLPVARSRRRFRVPGAALGVAAVLALVLLVAGVAAYLYLPTATITIRPAVETIRLPPFTVTADPDVTQVDADGAVIPATTLDVPVTTRIEQTATGERVEESLATGSVRFDSINTVGPVSVPDGTRISTLGGIVFVTTEAITVPAAQVAGSTIERGTATARVRARVAGPEGNVESGDITQVPDFLRTQQVSAINPGPTSGGSREVFTQVQQSDVDAAVAGLREALAAEFESALGNPAGVPAGATTFPEAAVLGEPVITPDPATLVGQEVASFTLEATATGTTLAVDEAPLTGIVEARIGSQVSPDHELVSGSIEPTVGDGVVADGVVTFTLSATASEVAILDGDALEAGIRGRPIPQVEQELQALGDVSVEAWPDFVTTIPTLEDRVEVIVDGAADGTDGSDEPVPSG